MTRAYKEASDYFPYFIDQENKLILSTALQEINKNGAFETISEEEVETINTQIVSSTAEKIHGQMIFSLCSAFVGNQHIIKDLFIGEPLTANIEISSIDTFSIPSLCEQLHVAFLNSKFEIKGGKLYRGKSKANLIEKGAVYTDTRITDEIVTNTLKPYDLIFDDFRILDFACGTGRFYDSIIKELKRKYGIEPKLSITRFIHAIDIDPVAINITRIKAISHIENPTKEDFEAIATNIIMKDALLHDNCLIPDKSALSNDDLEGRFRCGYDAIVSNPPYLVLKPNKKKLGATAAQNLVNKVNYFRSCGFYKYSIEGMLNLYQLSIETMLDMLKPNGSLGVICPSTLFADMSASQLRRFMLIRNRVTGIKFFSEEDQLFENVTQATCIFYLLKGGSSNEITIFDNNGNFTVPVELVKLLFPENLEIPAITHVEWNILKVLSKLKKLKEHPHIRNRRGELDLTLLKDYITTSQTPYRLVRGNMIGPDEIKDVNGEYVIEDFIKIKSQDYLQYDFNHPRLICQQISNMGCSKRLRFVMSAPNDILGNSCNYISADIETLQKLFLILNSSILNWRFKVTSSNNHINNYELAELPIVPLETIDAKFSYSTQEELDRYIGTKYGLSDDEISFLIAL